MLVTDFQGELQLDTLRYRLRRKKQGGQPFIAAVVSCFLAAVLLIVPSTSTVPAAEAANSSGEWVSLAAGPAPASNPLEGFVPYAGSYERVPYSMEWFYVPVNSVVVGARTYNWSSFESQLNAIAARGHQAVFRFYLDYPGKASGVPEYLLKSGLTTRAYTDHDNRGVSVSPNYEDPRLLEALDGFIAAFGSRYDGDPRIGFIQMGLLGFWGEWHTYPHDGSATPENWLASPATQQRVLQAYTKAFTRTKLQVRYPDAANSTLSVGYHDDSFAVGTLPGTGWHFMDKLTQAGATEKWLTQPVGGELRPEIQHCIFDGPMRCPVIENGADNDFAASAKATHASWLLNQHAFNPGYSGQALTNATTASRSLGYRFQATAFAVTRGAVKGQSDLSVTVRNTGTAPFYYDWPVRSLQSITRGRLFEHGRHRGSFLG
ncbi:hypothetical protein QFZ65_000690 [Arthrobacter sp. B3I9]|uniref:DUF4832 domain-containing protein n=1 Tax=Arthrobacter sp. B3I9 TaxID=3042270 RepID=UPI0027925816|nr:DUF4832 domain-containing protein [Arthrobacter sp. B3I9]MDQ0848752.1 hypothetical protein [Arthrobacter sp. B3I9]